VFPPKSAVFLYCVSNVQLYPKLPQLATKKMAGYIGQLGEFQESKGDFESYMERLGQWAELNAIGEDKKGNVLLSLMGPNPYKLLKDIILPVKTKRKII